MWVIYGLTFLDKIPMKDIIYNQLTTCTIIKFYWFLKEPLNFNPLGNYVFLWIQSIRTGRNRSGKNAKNPARILEEKFEFKYRKGSKTKWPKCSFLDYYESKLSLISQEIMSLLVNHQFIPFPIQPRSISLEKHCNERSQATVIT